MTTWSRTRSSSHMSSSPGTCFLLIAKRAPRAPPKHYWRTSTASRYENVLSMDGSVHLKKGLVRRRTSRKSSWIYGGGCVVYPQNGNADTGARSEQPTETPVIAILSREANTTKVTSFGVQRFSLALSPTNQYCLSNGS